MFKVTKVIQFCYGHRLLNYEGKCRYLHGHNARVEIELSAPQLDARGMVMDFVEVKQRLQGWIDSTLDHKMILNRADPILPQLTAAKEPMVPFEGNPTAEALAKFVYDHAKAEGFPITEVRFWETPTSFATYSARSS